tara:strand:- start:505 stop:696 length:192 start_codon:yes stop_codon:yes gene_type:complete
MEIDLDRDQLDLLLEALKSHSITLKNELKDFYEESSEHFEIEEEIDMVADLTNYIQDQTDEKI